MPITYNASGLIPAPLVDIVKNYVTDEAGEILYPEYNITLHGTIVKVQPGDDLNDVVDEQQRIVDIFSEHGKLLKLEAPSAGTGTWEFYPTVENISFDNGVWVNLCRYTVSLKAIGSDREAAPSGQIKNASENWQVAEQENGLYQVSHNINAVGLLVYTSGVANDPLAKAKSYCSSRKTTVNPDGSLSFGSAAYAFSSNLAIPMATSSGYWNYSSFEGIGVEDNSWSLNENFIYFNPTTGLSKSREEWTVTVTKDSSDALDNQQVSIQGTVVGFAAANKDGSTKYTNALADWNGYVSTQLYTRCTGAVDSGITLNPYPFSSNVTHNKVDGNIQYNYIFRGSLAPLVSGAIQENFDITDIHPQSIFAEIPVPGRDAGPVVQHMGTISLRERSVSYSAIFSSGILTGTTDASSLLARYQNKPNVENLFYALLPSGSYYYVKSSTESWSPLSLRYQREVSWVIDGSGYIGAKDIDPIDNPYLG